MTGEPKEGSARLYQTCLASDKIVFSNTYVDVNYRVSHITYL